MAEVAGPTPADPGREVKITVAVPPDWEVQHYYCEGFKLIEGGPLWVQHGESLRQIDGKSCWEILFLRMGANFLLSQAYDPDGGGEVRRVEDADLIEVSFTEYELAEASTWRGEANSLSFERHDDGIGLQWSEG